MNSAEERENDIRALLEKLDRMTKNDQLASLRDLLEKHLKLKEQEFLLGKHDIMNIMSKAGSNFAEESSRVYINKAELNYEEKRVMAIVEATVSNLIHSGAITRIIRFDKDNN